VKPRESGSRGRKPDTCIQQKALRMARDGAESTRAYGASHMIGVQLRLVSIGSGVGWSGAPPWGRVEHRSVHHRGWKWRGRVSVRTLTQKDGGERHGREMPSRARRAGLSFARAQTCEQMINNQEQQHHLVMRRGQHAMQRWMSHRCAAPWWPRHKTHSLTTASGEPQMSRNFPQCSPARPCSPFWPWWRWRQPTAPAGAHFRPRAKQSTPLLTLSKSSSARGVSV
jgi:hypothetical protein